MEIRDEITKYLEAGNSAEDILAMLNSELNAAVEKRNQKTKEYRKLELAKAVAEAVNAFVSEVYPDYAGESLDAREIVTIADDTVKAFSALEKCTFPLRGGVKTVATKAADAARSADDVIREFLASL